MSTVHGTHRSSSVEHYLVLDEQCDWSIGKLFGGW